MSTAHDYTDIDARIFAHKTGQQRAAMVEAARGAVQQRAERQEASKGRRLPPEVLYAVVEDVLHAAGCVEVRCMYKRPGVVQVRAEGMLGRCLRDDEVCEVVQRAEGVLQATGEYRTHVTWDSEPPVLYVATVPLYVGLDL